MTLGDLPVISAVFDAGADDRIFDSPLLLGPLVIGLAILLNRTLLTESLALVYLGVFVTYVLYRRLR